MVLGNTPRVSALKAILSSANTLNASCQCHRLARVAYAGGSYEVTNSTIQPGSGELLAETAVRLLRDAASGSKP